jgi:hypothetical protein
MKKIISYFIIFLLTGYISNLSCSNYCESFVFRLLRTELQPANAKNIKLESDHNGKISVSDSTDYSKTNFIPDHTKSIVGKNQYYFPFISKVNYSYQYIDDDTKHTGEIYFLNIVFRLFFRLSSLE